MSTCPSDCDQIPPLQDELNTDLEQYPLTLAAHRFANQTAIISSKGDDIIWRQVNYTAFRMAGYLQQRGLKKGDRLAVYLPNSPKYAVTFFAALKLGVITVPISNLLPNNDLANTLLRLDCKTLITDTNEHRDAVPIETIYLHQIEWGRSPSSTDFHSEQDASILLTSENSDSGKAVLHTYSAHYYSAAGFNQNIPFCPGNRWLASLPFYRVDGLAILMRAALGGGSLVFPTAGEKLADSIGKHNITHVSMSPTQLSHLLADSNNLSKAQKSLQAILIEDGPIPPELVEQAQDAGLPIFNRYGSTEASSQVTTTAQDDTAQHLTTAGKPLPWRQIKIAPDGEIMLKGPTLLKGYLEYDSLVDPFDANGWFASGDIGTLDQDNYLQVTDRKDDL